MCVLQRCHAGAQGRAITARCAVTKNASPDVLARTTLIALPVVTSLSMDSVWKNALLVASCSVSIFAASSQVGSKETASTKTIEVGRLLTPLHGRAHLGECRLVFSEARGMVK